MLIHRNRGDDVNSQKYRENYIGQNKGREGIILFSSIYARKKLKLTIFSNKKKYKKKLSQGGGKYPFWLAPLHGEERDGDTYL